MQSFLQADRDSRRTSSVTTKVKVKVKKKKKKKKKNPLASSSCRRDVLMRITLPDSLLTAALQVLSCFLLQRLQQFFPLLSGFDARVLVTATAEKQHERDVDVDFS